MSKMMGGHALVRSLENEGIRHVFGVPGAGQYEAIDGFYGRDHIRYISCRSEQPTTYMCDGYGRVGDQMAAAIVLPGEGLFNASTGMATAFKNSSPMVVISGPQDTKIPGSSGAGAAGEDEWRTPIDWVCKWKRKIRGAAEIPQVVHEAVDAARSGQPRPAFIEITTPTLAAVEEIELLAPSGAAAAGATAASDGGPPAGVEAVARALADAQRPLILAGTGVVRSGASDALTRLAERLGAAVLTTNASKGVISARHPLAVGVPHMRYQPVADFIAQADVVLFVGTTSGNAALGAAEGRTVLRIDIEQERLDEHPPEIGICADAGAALDGLVEALGPGEPRNDLTAEIATLAKGSTSAEEQLQPQKSFTEAMRRGLPDDAIFVHDMTQLGYYSRYYYPVYAPGGYQIPKGNLGASFPIAIGAKVAQPDRPAVAVTGDGGFLYHCQELATMTLHDIAVVTVVFTDNAYGNVMRSQQEDFDDHVMGVQLTNPDFVALAESFGVHGARATDAAGLEAELSKALASDKPAVIEVPVGPMERRY